MTPGYPPSPSTSTRRTRLLRFLAPWTAPGGGYEVRVGATRLSAEVLSDDALEDLAFRIVADFWAGRRRVRLNRPLYLAALLGADTASLSAFAPKDAVEGMIAAQAVALHHASMECLRRAMIPEQPAEMAAKLRKDGANLGRAFSDMLDALARHRGKGPQVVRVERVVVQDGGQAIVGSVATGEGRG